MQDLDDATEALGVAKKDLDTFSGMDPYCKVKVNSRVEKKTEIAQLQTIVEDVLKQAREPSLAESFGVAPCVSFKAM